MTDTEGFEKWATECGFDITKWKNGVYKISATTLIFSMWQEKQREIDALKHKLAVTDDGFKAAETLLKNLEPENAALKAEVERLRGIISQVPQTPEAVISFIGSHFNAMEPIGSDGKPEGDLHNVMYSLTVHDLLSAFSWALLDQNAIDAAMKETK